MEFPNFMARLSSLGEKSLERSGTITNFAAATESLVKVHIFQYSNNYIYKC